MARFVALNWSCRLAAGLAIYAGCSFSLHAQQPAMAPAAGKTLAPNTPPPTLGQYGKILAPGDQPGHPLKLRLPFPEAGQVKLPTADELNARDKLEKLAELSDAEIRAQLAQWPAYGTMSLRDQGALLQRIQDFRDFRTSVAKAKAHDLGLLTLTPDQFAKFEKQYWDKRLQMDNDLAKQFTPIYKAREQRLNDELYRQFSTLNLVPPPKPPAPKPPGPVIKPAPLASSLATNIIAMPVQPVAQAPH